MSGVLHPVGPEPGRVYWLRRIIVFAAAVLALVLVIAVVVNLNSAASASGPEAVPAALESSSPALAPAQSPTAVSPAPDTASPTPSATATSTPNTTPSPVPGSTPSDAAKSSAASTPSAKSGAKASKTTAAPSPTAIADCRAADLRPTLTGPQRVKVKAKAAFDLSLINGGAQPCRLKLTPDNFVLTITSGRDRIWTTADCTDLVKPTSVKIASEDAYAWRLTWDGRRSKKSCAVRPEIPRAGTYVATADFDGADPVSFRFFVKK